MTTQTLPRLHVGVGWRSDGLALFPVWAEMPVHDLIVVNAEHVEVAERTGSPTVGELVLTNTSDHPALLIEGELLEGGWQNRALNADILLGAHESQVAPVTCVEQGRWSGGAQHTRRARMAPGSVRVALRTPGSHRQRDVWNRVSRYEPTMGPTRTMSLSEQLDKISAGRDSAGRPVGRARRSQIPAAPLPGQMGVIGALSGQPAWLEIFPSPGAFADFWPALVDAALLDAHTAFNVPCPAQAARDFAIHCGGISLHSSQSAGAGVNVTSRPSPISVRGITSGKGDLLHAYAVNTEHRIWGEA